MKFKDIIASSIFLKGIFALSLFILLFLSAISYQHANNISKSTEALGHSHAVHIELEALISYVKDAETGQRGFIITRDSAFLEPYMGVRNKVERSMYILDKLAAKNLNQKKNIDKLAKLISLRFLYLSKTMKLSTNYSTSDPQTIECFVQGKKAMDDLRWQINDMIGLEKMILSEKQKKLKSDLSFSPLFTFFLLLFSILIFAISYVKINNDLYKSEATNAHLRLNIALIRQAEEIGKFSTWDWNLETNKLSYSDNQYLLLGVEPQSFEPTIDHYLAFVHPDDRHIITEGGIKMMETNIPTTAFFRIIRADGELRYFTSKSKIVHHANGTKILIGINSDVTAQHKKDLAIQERNFELQQTNKELESFNYVASHDLQEPLRIIQLYISRISEKEFNNLSENSRDYFDRIQASANRMQVLINDLLLFSRTNKIENAFEQSDLNDLLLGAKEDMAELIKEKKAIINVKVLPTLMVIPFQIQQLFSNLISNSLKYSNAEVQPVIKISCEPVVAKDYPQLKGHPDKNYCKISFEDNGLGFEQEFAENIFILFKRLHNKNEFPGTGIGLSICKKIAENHFGSITAEGKPNEGAIFSLFLP